MENIVYMELLRRGYQVTVGKSGEREVDFIGARQKEKLYIQVSYLLASDDTISREFGLYDLIRDNYPKYVVSMDEFDFGRNGINLPLRLTAFFGAAVNRRGSQPEGAAPTKWPVIYTASISSIL